MRKAMHCAKFVLVAVAAAVCAPAQESQAVADAKLLLREAGALVQEADELQQSSIATNVSGQQARAGDVAGALATIQSVRNPVAPGQLYSGLTSHMAAHGNWSDAMKLLADLPEGSGRSISYFGIGSILAHQHDFANARLVAYAIQQEPDGGSQYRDLLALIALEEGSSPRQAMAAHASQATLDQVRSMQPGATRAQAFAQLAMQQAAQKDPAAPVTVTLAQEDARTTAGVPSQTFEMIAVTRGATGDLPGALSVVNQLDPSSRAWPLWNLTGMMVHAGQRNEALAIARSQESRTARAYALLGIASALLDK
jgi:hypothetical protein